VSGVQIVIPHPHDLIISKLAAGRPKDFEFAIAVARMFPMTDIEEQQLEGEFRQAHPGLEKQLQRNIETWKHLLSEQKKNHSN
jgi:hypothetical protein